MGLLDSIFGRKRLPPSETSKLGAIAGAELTVRTELSATPTGKAGLAVKAVAASEFDRVRTELEQMLKLAGEDLGSTCETSTDKFGFVWVVIADDEFPDVVAAAQVAAETITEEGFRDQLLCAVFPFTIEPRRPLYLVYAFKRGAFYAFAPKEGETRDVALELQAHALLQHELPLEGSLEYRYPLWGIPL